MELKYYDDFATNHFLGVYLKEQLAVIDEGIARKLKQVNRPEEAKSNDLAVFMVDTITASRIKGEYVILNGRGMLSFLQSSVGSQPFVFPRKFLSKDGKCAIAFDREVSRRRVDIQNSKAVAVEIGFSFGLCVPIDFKEPVAPPIKVVKGFYEEIKDGIVRLFKVKKE